MDWRDESSSAVSEIEESLDSHISREKAHRAKKVLDNVMPFVLLLIGFVILFEFFIPVTSRMEIWIKRANWALIAYFATRLVVAFRLSRDHERFMQDHWLDILLVVPVFSLFQEVKIARFAPAVDDMPVFRRGILRAMRFESTASNAAKLTRITRIIKKSV